VRLETAEKDLSVAKKKSIHGDYLRLADFRKKNG
jgi:hypothetical protein